VVSGSEGYGFLAAAACPGMSEGDHCSGMVEIPACIPAIRPVDSARLALLGLSEWRSCPDHLCEMGGSGRSACMT